jgi:CelD/BcsL family acetyltransferase involved in cellulose biosynthesis
MTIQLIQSYDEFLDLSEEWNTLLTYSASHVPFLRHEYLANWWKTLGGGEWEQGELRILTQRDQKHQLTGVAPFFSIGQQVRFLGSTEISDYLDLITAPHNLSGFLVEIMQFLDSAEFPGWQSLILDNLLESSPSVIQIEKTARQMGFSYDRQVLQPAPYVPLPSSWEDYLVSLEDRYRREIQRKIRKAETYFLPVDWYLVTEPGSLEGEVHDFLDLMANNPQKREFLTDPMIEQIKNTVSAGFQAGWLQLAFLTVGDLKVAGYLNFDYDGKIWIYNSGINPMFENLSPGWVLLGKLIQWSIQQGRTELDFMRGDEDYKYQFGGIDKNVLRLTIIK